MPNIHRIKTRGRRRWGMDSVWIVGVSDCEGNSIKAVCATKEIAERELFKARDELVDEYKKMDKWQLQSAKDHCAKEGKPLDTSGGYFQIYKNMITALSGNDYKKWDNYPHDRPYLYKVEIIKD
jgi:hypothetical protein